MVTVRVSDKQGNETVTEQEPDKMVPKRNSTGSIIWQWFGFPKEDVEPKCGTWYLVLVVMWSHVTWLHSNLELVFLAQNLHTLNTDDSVLVQE